MSTYEDQEGNLPPEKETYYETLASQEELYLEETEEEVYEVLISDVSVSHSRVISDAHPITEVGEELNRAAEELITGDSDDPPLSTEAVEELLNTEPTRLRRAG